MALTTDGLSNGGVTTHYRFQYDDSLRQSAINPNGQEPTRTNQVIADCEGDFNLMSGWFRNIPLDVSFTIPINITQNDGGAGWSLSSDSSGRNLTITINPGNSGSAHIRYLLVSEMVEQFMRAQGLGWFGTGTEGSQGEGLSRFLAAQFLASNGLGNPRNDFFNSNVWLRSSRADSVNNINYTDDGPDAVTGCSLLFIYYLFSQLGFDINDIVTAAANTLGKVYKNLTKDVVDPFPFFKQTVDAAFPGTSIITTGNLDNPFPLPSTRNLSTRLYIAALPPAQRTNSIRSLITMSGKHRLRTTLNTNRSAALGSRPLSTQRYIAALPPTQRTNSIRSLITMSGKHTLRPTLNTNRDAALF